MLRRKVQMGALGSGSAIFRESIEPHVGPVSALFVDQNMGLEKRRKGEKYLRKLAVEEMVR